MTARPASPDFNLANGYDYMLGRGYAATSRLNLQYFLWKEALGFDIHPSIRIVGGSMRVADVATGTGIWLTEIARQLPTASLYGLDISLAQVPPREWLPHNVVLRTWDIFEEVPQELLGSFDLVHVRLLVLVVQKGDPRPIIRNLFKLLKPGGYLQWDDLNYPDTHIRVIGNSSDTPKLHELRKMVYSQGRHDWTLQLVTLFNESGLIDTELFHYEDRPELIKANGEQHLLTMEEFASSLSATGRKLEASTILGLIRDVQKEMSAGAALSMPRVVCIGKKPSIDAEVSRWYKSDIGKRLKPRTRKLYEIWSGIIEKDLTAHLHQIRDQAWRIAQYPCIGEWIFLLPILASLPQYPRVLAQAKAGAIVLDLGCCLGQDLRLLAADGASSQSMYASDISQKLWELGFELFRDHERMCAKFIQADILDPNSNLGHLSGQIDIIVAGQILHLFNWEQQLVAMKRIVDLSKTGTMLIGFQRGQLQAQAVARPWGQMFLHDLESFRQIWDKVEEQTASHWDLEADMVDLRVWGMEEEDIEWMPPGPRGLNFAATRRV